MGKGSSRRDMLAEIRSPLAGKLVEAMPEPALLVDAEGRAIHANAPAKELLPGLRLGDPLVLSLRSPDVHDAIRRVAATGEPETSQWSERVPVERLFEVSVKPITSNEGDAIATLVTLRDLTESRQVERMRADFIANASHELRTPLASLLGFVETLQGSAQNDARVQQKFLTIMREQGRRMARLIDDLLSLSRIEQKQHLRPEAAIDLGQVSRHVVDTLSPMASELGVDVQLHIEEPVIVTGDRDELVRVAENLIENAIKYGANGEDSARVEVTLGKNAREGWLAVRDFGRGIAPEHLPRLTERFYRVDPGQSRAKNGTGLGLAIVKHILARHRGRLTIVSRLDNGSTFTAYAPLKGEKSK
jgi:two-component system, OmpR family, phosphate regulon sensor histidine kinase PhoR